MNKPEHVYVTYIRSTPEKVWAAITTPEFTRQYWGGAANLSDWKRGSSWKHVFDDDGGVPAVTGTVVESRPPAHLALSWVSPKDPTDISRVTFDIESFPDMVCLKVVHGDFVAGSSMEGKVSKGWPKVLSSLKSFLETGTPLDIFSEKCDSPAATAGHSKGT